MTDKFKTGNINWLFNKEYYSQTDLRGDGQKISFAYVPLVNKQDKTKVVIDNIKVIKSANAKVLTQKSEWLEQKKWSDYKPYADELISNAAMLPGNMPFRLLVENPGLIFGTGNTHETGNEGEFKIGFTFDAATGLPIIPGSSFKGKVSKWFVEEDKIQVLIYHLTEGELASKLSINKSEINEAFIQILHKEMFEGIVINNGTQKRLSIYEKDIFHSAILIDSRHNNNLFLGRDAITPHGDNPLKNPTPLPFIKVLPYTQFQFNCTFTDGQFLKKEEKKAIVEFIILQFGIGAKTNVGYGQFSETVSTNVVSDNSSPNEVEIGSKVPANTRATKLITKIDITTVNEIIKTKKFEGKCTLEDEKYFSFEFVINRITNTVCKRKEKCTGINIDDHVWIEFSNANSNTDFNNPPVKVSLKQ